jgi:hypothetical protein
MNSMNELSAHGQMTVSSFHEAAHAVAAIELMMLGVSARIRRDKSTRGIPTDADISFACPNLVDEPPWRALQRKLVVMLAGPEWELFAAVRSTRRQILQEQRDDRIAVIHIIKQLRNLCGVHGRALKKCIEDAWNEAGNIRESRNHHIVRIADALQASGALNDSQLRVLFAQSSFEGPGIQLSRK